VSRPAAGPDLELSAIVIAQDEAERIERCLRSLACCDEVLVLDGGSRDDTAARAAALGARVESHPYDGMNRQKDRARRRARGRWVLNVDADEEVPRSLAVEIRAAIAAAPDDLAGFRIPRRTYLGDRWLRHAGYYPDRQLRLVRRERARWDVTHDPHDRVLVEGRVGILDADLLHHGLPGVDHLWRRADRYADAAANAMLERGQRAGPGAALVHGWARFLKAYVLQGGFLLGGLGLTLSRAQAYEVREKYYRLARLHQPGRDVAGGSRGR